MCFIKINNEWFQEPLSEQGKYTKIESKDICKGLDEIIDVKHFADILIKISEIREKNDEITFKLNKIQFENFKLIDIDKFIINNFEIENKINNDEIEYLIDKREVLDFQELLLEKRLFDLGYDYNFIENIDEENRMKRWEKDLEVNSNE